MLSPAAIVAPIRVACDNWISFPDATYESFLLDQSEYIYLLHPFGHVEYLVHPVICWIFRSRHFLLGLALNCLPRSEKVLDVGRC